MVGLGMGAKNYQLKLHRNKNTTSKEEIFGFLHIQIWRMIKARIRNREMLLIKVKLEWYLIL